MARVKRVFDILRESVDSHRRALLEAAGEEVGLKSSSRIVSSITLRLSAVTRAVPFRMRDAEVVS